MSGIFTLGKVGIRQGKGTWSTASDVWLIGSPVAVKESPFGYFGGGVLLSTINKCIFGNIIFISIYLFLLPLAC